MKKCEEGTVAIIKNPALVAQYKTAFKKSAEDFVARSKSYQERSPEEVLEMVKDAVESEDRFLIVALDSLYRLVGWAALNLVEFDDGERRVEVLATYTRPGKCPLSLAKLIHQQIDDVAREEGIDKIEMVSTRNSKAWERKWGYRPVAIVYERRLSDEQ